MIDSPFHRAPKNLPPTEEETDASPKSQHQPEFDPFTNAKVTSPFYCYNHDSPRPSQDLKLPPVPNVRDLEAGSARSLDLTPTVSREKQEAQRKDTIATSRSSLWTQPKQCLTKPKHRSCAWWFDLTSWQRVMIKMLIAFLMVGAIVGVAVGVAISTNTGVYKNSNTTTDIGKPQ